jgi:hypothetical protein
MHNYPLGEPYLTNVNKHLDDFHFKPDHRQLFKDGATYGFNLRDIYCKDLEKTIFELRLMLKQLKDEGHTHTV